MFFSRKATLGIFQRSVRNFCPKIVRNEGISVRKLNVRNKTSEIFCKYNVIKNYIVGYVGQRNCCI